MFCPKCGTEVESDVKFCPSCGSAIASAVTPIVEEPSPKVEASSASSDIVQDAPDTTLTLKETSTQEGKGTKGFDAAKLFCATHGNFFDANDIPLITQKLAGLSDEQMLVVNALDFKSPTTMLLISIFLGGLGIDRFMLKETGMGVLKLLTAGLCGILWLIDIFGVQGKTRKYNLNLLNNALIGVK